MDQSLTATLLHDLCALVGKPIPERAEIRIWGMSGVERVTFPDGETAVFKYAKEPFDREAQALRVAHQRGLPVPELHATAMRTSGSGCSWTTSAPPCGMPTTSMASPPP